MLKFMVVTGAPLAMLTAAVAADYRARSRLHASNGRKSANWQVPGRQSRLRQGPSPDRYEGLIRRFNLRARLSPS
jgi:hypothetical protein